MDPRHRGILLLSSVPGVGPTRLRSLVQYFGDPGVVLAATPMELATVEGVEQKTALAISRFARSSARAEAERQIDDQCRRMERIGARTVSLWDEEYPANLKKIYDPPPLLFLRGSFTPADNYAIAVVGTRTPSPYGIQLATKFATGLAALGLTVISGLARGIDTHAHAAAARASGRTVAVIGSGVDVIYPPENAALAERIIGLGALASECTMGAKPDAVNFPRRNRIVSGIALGTLIIETSVDGGAMITANTALDQNREVFAVPSPVQEQRQSGTNKLIKEGKALLTESVDDIIAELHPRLKQALRSSGSAAAETLPPLSLFETRIAEVLGDTPMHIDLIAERAEMSCAETLVHLLSLEFKGVVRQIPGKLFVRR